MRAKILTRANSKAIGFRVLKSDEVVGNDVLIALEELFGLMGHVVTKIGKPLTLKDWKEWTKDFHPEIQERVELAIKHREGLN